MKKTAIVTDSNSGIGPAEAERLGIHIVPMPFIINSKEYFEFISLSQDEFYRMLMADASVSTSQPSPGELIKLWDELLCTHDEILHIPMSSGLSFSCSTAVALSAEYSGRVQVCDNHAISTTLRQAVLNAINLRDKGKRAEQIKDILESHRDQSSIYIMLDTLKYLIKGGRLTPAAAAIGSILRIRPILKLSGGKLDAHAKARNTKQGRAMMIDALRHDMDTRLMSQKLSLRVAYSYDEEAAQSFAEEVRLAFPEYEIGMDPLSLSVACHIGPGALALTASQII